jgi:hypothetical protein
MSVVIYIYICIYNTLALFKIKYKLAELLNINNTCVVAFCSVQSSGYKCLYDNDAPVVGRYGNYIGIRIFTSRWLFISVDETRLLYRLL